MPASVPTREEARLIMHRARAPRSALRLLVAIALTPAALAFADGRVDLDTDGDGLSDFREIHKHRTDPLNADTDGDGIPDGDWRERREHTYTVRSILQVMPPCDPASMTDDYQDARVLEEREDVVEVEVVHYPLNTVADAITADPGWSSPGRASHPDLARYLAPGVTTNWNGDMRAALVAALRADGIDVDALSDRQVVERVARWLLQRGRFEDSFTTFAVDFPGDGPRLAPGMEAGVEATLREIGRTLDEQWQRELFGRGMFETRRYGTCTSSAIYVATVLKALGIPTRTIVGVPVIDASDDREVEMVSRLAHHDVRRAIASSAERRGDAWASHTLNEVYVGGRWRRLDGDRLGRNILDEEGLGLMTHVHTFADLSEARLVTWGRRHASGRRDDVFGHANPYSCISLSDHFGVHAEVPNPSAPPPVTVPPEYRSLTITHAYWYDDPSRPAVVRMRLDDPATAGHLVVRVAEGHPGAGPEQFWPFYEAVGKGFVLHADGERPIRAVATRGYWVDIAAGVKDFYLRIPPEELPSMRPGVPYALVAMNGADDRQWIVDPAVTITRPPPSTP